MIFAAPLLLMASGAEAPNAAKAQWALQRAATAGFNLAVTVCGDAGRSADVRRLALEQRRLEQAFHRIYGRWANDEIVLDDRSDCEKAGLYRRYLNDYSMALADARDAMGTE